MPATEQRREGLRPWILAGRPKTLPAAAVPVLVGTALAFRTGQWEPVAALICLLFALLVQIGTNLANDYFDYIQGADTPQRIGPTRMVASGAIAPRAMARGAGAVFALAFLLGSLLVQYGGWWLILVGAASIAFGYLYTGGRFALAYLGLGDVFVLIFFGLVAVGFTFYVQTGFFAAEAWWAGAGVGALAVNLLVVNNHRDRESDSRASKKTLAVRYGRRVVEWEYLAMAGLGAAVPLILWLRGFGPAVLLPLVILPGAIRLWSKLRRADAREANRLLGPTAGILLAYGALLAAGIVRA